MRKAEEDLQARQQALYLHGKALDGVTNSLPRSLRHLAPGIAHASALAIAQVLGFGNTPRASPTAPPSPPEAATSAQSGTSDARGTYASAAAKGASQTKSDRAVSATAKKAPKPRKPKRNLVLLTLPEEARDQAPHPHAVKQLPAATGPVEALWATKTGYAAAVKGPADKFAEHAQEAAARISTQARAATPTFGYVVTRVPTTLRDLAGGVATVTEPMLASEAAAVTKKKVTRAAWSRHSPGGGLERTAVIFVAEKPAKEFRLFSSSAPSHPINRTATVAQCGRC